MTAGVKRTVGSVMLAALGLAWSPAEASMRPAQRTRALTALTGGRVDLVPCLSPRLQALVTDPGDAPAASTQALRVLQRELSAGGDERRTLLDGVLFRWNAAFPDPEPTRQLSAVREGLATMRRLLIEELGLPEPGPLQVVLARVAPLDGGYFLPRDDRAGGLIVLPVAAGDEALRREAAHQLAHAVTQQLGPGVPAVWGEGLAVWATARLEGEADAGELARMTLRLRRLERGLLADDLELAAGNALWLTFLDEAYGSTLIPKLFRELQAASDAREALDAALLDFSGVGFDEAFREFQLWTVLTGDRSDGRHFSFAHRIGPPTFLAAAVGLPSFASPERAAVAPMGAASVLVRPDDDEGGMTLALDGDPLGRWSADALMVRDDGGLQRVALAIGEDGRGEITLPLDRLDEVILLVRNLAPADRTASGFRWTVDRAPRFPYQLGRLNAETDADGTVQLAWETVVEQDLVGFNVVRVERTEDATPIRVNALWIPAMGGGEGPAAYRFVDPSALEGRTYEYRIEGLTTHGLTSLSSPIVVSVSSR